MSKMIPAGIVTAYGAAVRGGYQGTYEEFCAALGDLARVLEEFERFSVSVTTLEPGEPATADYSDGVLTLGIPAGETGNGIASAELNQNYTLTLTWTNGESTTVGPIRGATGQTPDFEIGTVQTLQPDQPASASITGTPEHPVLNLAIPKGDPGQDGASDAGDVTFDPEEDYDEGTVGKALKDELIAISQLDGILDIADDTSEMPVHAHAGGNSLLLYSGVIYAQTKAGNYRDDYAVTAGDTVFLNATSDGTIEYVYCFTNRDLTNGSATVIANSYTQTTEASVELTVPEGAAYLFVTAVNEVTVKALAVAGKKSERLDGIESDITGLESDISELNTIVPVMDESLKNVAKSVGKHTMYVETWSAFPYRKLPTSFNQTNPFVVTGSSGDSVVSIVSGGATLTSNDQDSGLVIQGDSGEWSTHVLVSYTANSITIFPALPDDVTDGILAPFAFDTQHLTKYGYMAYMQHINAANPKHCEKNKYVAKYHPVAGNTPTPFSPLGMDKGAWTYSRSYGENVMKQYGSFGTIIYPYVAYSTPSKYGAYWTVDTGNNAGYLETFIGVSELNTSNVVKDQGYLMRIVVSADDQVIYQKDKDSNIVERICVDFTESQKNIKLEVYYDTMRANSADSIFIGETTFWVNEKYPDNILPAGSTVSMLFDSWGAFHAETVVTEPDTPWHNGNTWGQGQSGETLKEIMRDKSGFVCPVYNTSKGDMTSRWGKAWFVEVKEKNPNIVLTDFGINDYHTSTGGTWSNIQDPYGNTIVMENNPLTQEEYANNMKTIFDMAIMSDIQPVFIEPNKGSSLEWTLDLLYRLSEQVT